MIWGSGGSKSRLAKAAGAEPAGQMRDEKLHAVVARSTFGSQNVKNTRGLDHFWKLRCRKSARRCGAKHISKSKCIKHTSSGPLLAVEMLKSARRCGAKHISKSICTKHHMFAPLLEVRMSKKVHAVVARRTFRSKNVKNTRGSDHFLSFRCRFASLHYTPLHYTTLHNTTTTTTQLHSTTLHYTKLHYTTHYTTLH